ncbi:hypothetical protein [Chitinophaga sp. RAB17]|uniref:hypothetical protein n=1 Tax=Chitinophaga sp. RAB17 TaxID=3233049 RepID=UPI003F8F0C54
MYCILNELSISPEGVVVANPGPLLKTLIDTFLKARTYKLEQVIVPSGFSDLAITSGMSAKAYKNTLDDPDEKSRINSFLANATQHFDGHYDQDFAAAEDGRLIDVSFDGVRSSSMRDAHICDLPLLSFDVDPFRTTTVNCDKYILTDAGEQTMPITVMNLHDPESFAAHEAAFLKLCQDIILKWERWDPADNPCWRKEVTDNILTDAGYPSFTGKESMQEKRSKNTKVVLDVLKANGWVYNYIVTGKNNRRAAIWKIFSNPMSNEQVYISVDLGEGEFEIQNRHGKWTNTTFFDGRKHPTKDYKGENSHDIKLR